MTEMTAHDIATKVATIITAATEPGDTQISAESLLAAIVVIGNSAQAAVLDCPEDKPDILSQNLGRLDVCTILVDAVTQVATATPPSHTDRTLGGYL